MQKLKQLLSWQSIFFVLIFLISQLFFVSLTISSLDSYWQKNTEQLISINLNSIANKINLITKYGRDIKNYQNAVADIYDLKIVSHAKDAFIIDNNGKIIHGKSIYGIENIDTKFTGDTTKIKDIEYKIATIYGLDKNVAGYILASITIPENEKISDKEETINFYKQIAIACIIAILFLLIYLSFFNLEKFKQSKFKIIILPFIIAQCIVIASMLSEVSSIIKNYNNITQVASIGSIQKDFKHVANLDIPLSEISGIKTYLNEIVQKADNIGYLALYDANKNIVASVGSKEKSISMEIFSKKAKTYGYVELSLSTFFILKFIGSLSLTLLTLSLISCIVTYELISLVNFEINRISNKLKKIPYETNIVRPISFLSCFAIFMPTSIVPIFMANFISDFPNLSKEVVMSFAVTTEMFAIGLCSLLLLIFKNRFKDIKKVLILGLVIISIGMFCSFISWNAYMYIGSRAIYGLGYGAIIVGLQLFVIDTTSLENRGKGMANFIAGLYSGILCGCAAGGLIADKIGQREVFLISSLMFIITLFILINIIKHRQSAQHNNEKVTENKLQFAKVISFIKNKEVASFLLLQVIPCSTITIGFFNFFLPVFINQNGLGASVVGQINFVYTALIIALSPVFGSLIDKSNRKYLYLIAGITLASLVPLLFSINNAIIAATLGMSILGLSMAINESGQPAIITTYKASDIIGNDSAVMVLDIILRIGQVIGPLIVASMLTIFGDNSFKYISIAILSFTVLFFITQVKSIKTKA